MRDCNQGALEDSARSRLSEITLAQEWSSSPKQDFEHNPG